MRDLTLQVDAEPSMEDIEKLGRGLSEHSLAFTSKPGFQPLAVLARDPEHRLVAGAAGHVNWNWLQINLVWVSQELRGSGLGRRLMDALEQEGRVRGCTCAHLDTFSYQARPFYEALGYDVFATLENYPPGHQRFYLRKEL